MILKPRRDHTVLYMCAVILGLGIRSFAQNCCFHCVFDSLSLFFPFFAIRSKSLLSLVAPVACHSCLSSLRCSFLKSNQSDSLLEKSKSLFRSFAHKKRAKSELLTLSNVHKNVLFKNSMVQLIISLYFQCQILLKWSLPTILFGSFFIKTYILFSQKF